MTIGIDIDDTLTNTTEYLYEHAKEYFKTTDEEQLRQLLDYNNENVMTEEFYGKILPEAISNYPLKDNACEVIKRLRGKGHKVVIITARGCTIDGLETKTNKYLNNHNIIVDKIIFKAHNKLNACLENKIDIMIDDSLNVMDQLRRTNIKLLLFNSMINENEVVGYQRVYNWLEVEKIVNVMECLI